MINPIPPTAAIPRKQIFMESQSSLLSGFLESFSNLELDLRNDLSPMVSRILSKISSNM
jgi:hypothetical protein